MKTLSLKASRTPQVPEIISSIAAAARRSALHIAVIGAALAIFGIAVDSRAILFTSAAVALSGAWLADSAKKGGRS